jgi:hypothetical protein
LPEDVLPDTGVATSGLIYNGDGNWHFNWKTPKTYTKQCRLVRVTLNDGTTHDFNTSFK